MAVWKNGLEENLAGRGCGLGIECLLIPVDLTVVSKNARYAKTMVWSLVANYG